MAQCASLATVSPNSWQLQRGSGLAPFPPLPCRPPPALLPCGIRRSGLSIRSSAVAGQGRGEEEEKKKTSGNRSWLEAGSSSTNSYAGWSSVDPTPNRKSLTGYLAAGAAGLVLTIGFAFASHSFYTRRGIKSLVMTPLVAEQEKILSSDSSNSADGDSVGEQGELSSSDVQEQKQNEESGIRAEVSGDLHETAGTNQSSLPHEETNGLRFEGGEGDVSISATAVSIQNVELKESESGPVDVVPVTDCRDVVSSPLPDSTTTAISKNMDSFAVLPDSEPNSVAMCDSANSSSLAAFHTENNSVSKVSESDGAASMLYSETEVSSIFPNVDTETSVFSTVSESSSMHLQTNSQNAEPILEVGESFVEKDPATSAVSDNAFPSDSTVLEPIIPTDLGATQNSSLPIASDVPESIREIKQFIASNESPLASETIASVVVTDGSDSAVAQTMSESGLNEKNDALDLPLLSSESEHSFPSVGIPAPSLRSAALHVAPGKVLVPAVVDHVQGQAFAALQALKVVEAGVEPSGLSTRREYARWLIASSAILARNPASKVFPAMFIENVTELAFDDVTPEDPDFPYIQGLAEAGLISSKLSIHDMDGSVEGGKPKNYVFSPDSPLSRQDLVSWKIALERKELPEVTRKMLWQKSGFIDIDKIHQDAWPALLADLLSGEQSIVAVAFGYTRLFQPDKPVTKAQAAVALATGEAAELVSEELARIEAESLADTAVATHAALEAQVQKDLNASFEKELELEREKVEVSQRLAEDAISELERIKGEREEERYSLLKERAALDSEREFLSKLRHELEEQLQIFLTNKLEISNERDQVTRLLKEAENDKYALVQIRSEVEVEKKALALARAWVEEEATKARVHARVLQEARDKWEKQGIQVLVDKELDDANTAVSILENRQEDQKQSGPLTLHEVPVREEYVKSLMVASNDMKEKISGVIGKLIHATELLLTSLQQRAGEAGGRVQELQQEAVIVASKAAQDLQQTTASTVAGLTSSIREGTKKLADECKGGAEKISQKFKV